MINNSYNTVTVGIPVHNEEKTLPGLLEWVFSQTQSNFRLEKVFIVCDGCTDNTPAVVKDLQTKYPSIKFKNDGERKGKAQRLNEIYEENGSDLLFTIDADITIKDKTVFENLVRVFANDPGALVVVPNTSPLFNDGLFGRAVYSGQTLWDRVRLSLPDGENINNIFGNFSVIRKDFAKVCRYPARFISDPSYLFVKAHQKAGFRFIPQVTIYYQTVTTVDDFRTWSGRSMYGEKEIMVREFGKDILDIYKIPMKYKVKGLFLSLRHDPLFTLVAMVLQTLVRLFPYTDPKLATGLWREALSTKMNQRLLRKGI